MDSTREHARLTKGVGEGPNVIGVDLDVSVNVNAWEVVRQTTACQESFVLGGVAMDTARTIGPHAAAMSAFCIRAPDSNDYYLELAAC